MKKFLLSCLCMLGFAFAANATDVYVNLIGAFNSWQDNGVKPDAEGIAVQNVKNVNTTFKFKIWDGSDHHFSANGELVPGEWVACDVTDGSVKTTVPAAYQTGNITIKYDVNNNKAFLVAKEGGEEPGDEPDTKVYAYLAGNFNSYNATDDNYKVEVVDNVATWTVTATEGFQFKAIYEGTWYGANTNDNVTAELPNNEENWYTTKGGGMGNNFTLPASATGKTVTIKFAVNTKDICATWEEEGETPVEDVVASFYAHGQTAIEGGTEITNIDNAYDSNITSETHNCASDFVNNGVTVTLDKGQHSSRPFVDMGGLIRFYATASASNTLTVSAASNIKSIVIECSNADYNKFAEMEGLDKEGATATWTGSAKSVEFTNTLASSSQSRIKTIVVTLEGGEGEDPVTPPTPDTKVYAYLAGNFNEWNAADAAYKAEVVDNVATWTITATEGFQFKAIYEGKWYGAWTDDNKTYELPNDEADWYHCKNEGMGNNFVLPAAAAGKTVTIKFAVDNKDICATWSEGEIPTPGTEEKSFTIVYKGANNDSNAYSDNAAYAANVEDNTYGEEGANVAVSTFVEGTRAYTSGNNAGLKLGKSSKPTDGTITIKFNEGFVKKATKVIVNAKRYKSTVAANLTVNPNIAGVAASEFAVQENSDNYTVSLDGTKELSTLTLSANKYLCVASITVVWNEEATGIEAVESEANVAPVYYNLQGARVENPANGLYIVVRGNKVSKEIIR